MARTLLSIRLVTAVALVLVAGAVAGAPASAATGHKSDEVGDAPGIIDIAGFTVLDDAARVVITADVPALRSRGRFNFEYSTSRYGGFYVFVAGNGPAPSVQARYCGEIRCNTVSCAGVRASWSTDRHQVKVTIPQRCYPDPLPNPGFFTVWSGSRTGHDEAGSLKVGLG